MSTKTTAVVRRFFIAAMLVSTSCRQSEPAPSKNSAPRAEPPASSSRPAAPRARKPPAPARPTFDPSEYPWLAEPTLSRPKRVDTLLERFEPPTGFERVALPTGSFGAWLRGLPLADPTTPVRTYRGSLLHPADHPHIAAVSALDIGKADLQQCADAVVRLHAEWSWSRGERSHSYRSASGVAMPYARWVRGERPVPRGQTIRWEARGRAGERDDYASFRRYLDQVFAWANTVSIAKQAKPVDVSDLRPGDFVILPGNPGHAVIVLDLARAKDGRRRALLGQSFMPAQSFQVLKPKGAEVWFGVDPNHTLDTPFWEPFPWSSLRRLDAPEAALD